MRDLAKGDLFTGLRHSELQALTVSDVGKDFVRVRESKGKKPRTVPLNKAGSEFFAELARAVRGLGPQQRLGQVQRRPMR